MYGRAKKPKSVKSSRPTALHNRNLLQKPIVRTFERFIALLLCTPLSPDSKGAEDEMNRLIMATLQRGRKKLAVTRYSSAAQDTPPSTLPPSRPPFWCCG